MWFGPSASAYTHFLRYLTARAPFTALPQKYDLNALPNKTISYYISEQGPTQLAANDSLTGVISQLRLAARMWNDIETSDLRLAFGGITPAGAPSSGPGIDVVFTDEIPPGLIAQTGFSQLGDPGPGGTFVPIVRSTVMLNRSMADRPSFSEAFFLTAVHEFGHAIGLQHSLVSSVMATEPTRGTSKARPLGADDIAGVSLLYPTRAFAATTGAISGRVTMGGDGVSMASVVAIPASGHAVGAITHPDGTYRIEGIPPGTYFLYVHPLPPAQRGEARPANIDLPVGPDGRAIAASGPFETIFFPSGREPSFPLTVTAGGTVENANLNVQRRNAVGIHTVQTYNFVNQVTIKPPTVNRNAGRGTLVAAGPGLTTNAGAAVAGLNPAVLANPGMVVAGSLRPYFAVPYLQMDLSLNPSLPEGPLHMLFSTPSDLYVLPSALTVASKGAPVITSLATASDSGGARVVQVTGTEFDRNTRILFDGQPAAIRSFDEAAGRFTVTPPPAPAGHRAAVVALNEDGQSSLFAQGNTPTSYTYDSGDASTFTVTPASLPAGVESVVEVTAAGMNLIDGMARLAFGSSDVAVRRTWVTASNRLVASVVVGAQASGSLTATLANGLQVTTQTAALAVQTGARSGLALSPNVVNPLTGQTSLTAGSPAIGFVSGVAAGATAAQMVLTLNDQPVPVSTFANGQIGFVLPLGLQPGPAILRLRVGADTALPVVIGIDPPPAVVVGIASAGATVDAARPVRSGDAVTVTVFGLVADAFTGLIPARQVVVNVAGTDHPAQSVVANQGRFDVTFTLGNVAAGTQPLVVVQDGRPSAPAALAVR